MTYVKARHGESIDDLLRRFKKAVNDSKILSDLKRYEYHEKPSVRKKRKQIAAKKRLLENKRKRKTKEKTRNISFKWNRDRTKKLPWKTTFKPGGHSNSRNRSGGGNNKPYKRDYNSKRKTTK